LALGPEATPDRRLVRQRVWPLAELVLAAVVVVLEIGVLFQIQRGALTRYTRVFLPGFDAWVYVAMAERPRVFTVSPFGYRILTPWLVAALPGGDVLAGFQIITLASLTTAGILILLYLRRLGHGTWLSLAAIMAFGLSPPVARLLANPFLVDPLTLVLLAGLLLASEAGASLAWLAPIGVCGVLSKEMFLFFLPIVYFVRRDREGRSRATATAALVLLPALVAVLLLRWKWTPHLPTSWPSPSGVLAFVTSGVGNAMRHASQWWWPVLVGGLVPLAIAGAVRPESRCFLRRYGYLLVVTVALAFAASAGLTRSDLQSARSEPVAFYCEDMTRLLVYSLPVLLPLGIAALNWVLPSSPHPTEPWRRRTSWLGVPLAGALAILPALGVDPYRRADLRGRRDGLEILTFCRDSTEFAAQLAKGETAVLWPRLYAMHALEGGDAAVKRIYWYLRDGWSKEAADGTLGIPMERQGSLVIPNLQAVDLEVELTLDAVPGTGLVALANEHRVAEGVLGGDLTRWSFRLPAAHLFRGDNRLTLQVTGDHRPGVRLYWVRVHSVGTPTR
jgi:hypothetical protein